MAATRSQLSAAMLLITVGLCRGFSSLPARGGSVAVIGGGFGGLYTALKLEELSKEAGNSRIEITLIDPKDKFVFLPLLYELAVGTASILEVAPRYSSILEDSGIKFIQDSAQLVDCEKNEVVLSGDKGVRRSFDQIVIASGAQPRTDMIPGAREHSMPFSRVEDAYALSTRLRALQAKGGIARVVVIGGGYSGVEVATNVAEYLGGGCKVSLLDRNEEVMHSSPLHNREHAKASLSGSGVDLVMGVDVKEITAAAVVHAPKDGSAQPTELPADLVITTCGVKVSALVEGLSVPKDTSGRVLTDRALRSVAHKRIFALGDCAAVDGELVPSTAQAAMQQAGIVAQNVIKQNNYDLDVNGLPTTALETFSFVNLGEMLTLGDTDASISSLGGLVKLQGPLAAMARRLVYVARQPTNKQRATALLGASITTGAKILLKFLPKA